MSEQHFSLHPDVHRIVVRLQQDDQFRQAAQENPEKALADYTLDEEERQAIQLLLTNWGQLPETIHAMTSELPRFLRSRSLRKILTSPQG